MIIDIFGEPPSWLKCEKINGPYGIYYRVRATREEARKITRRLHVKYRVYEEQWARSADYRKQFLKENPGPWRCAYCGKIIDRVQVDHVIPVGQTVKNPYARMLLEMRGIENVNDTKNLVPSCAKCNKAKSDHIGLWPLRAYLGKHNMQCLNFVFRDALRCAIGVSLLAIVFMCI